MICQGADGRPSGEGQSFHLHFCKLAECHQQHPPPQKKVTVQESTCINLRDLSPPGVTEAEGDTAGNGFASAKWLFIVP